MSKQCPQCQECEIDNDETVCGYCLDVYQTESENLAINEDWFESPYEADK